MVPRIGSSPHFDAKLAGVFYLLNILTILLAVFLFRGLVVAGNPAATATNLLAHQSRFQLGIAAEVISTACSICVAGLFYELLKPVNRSFSLVAAFFRLVACAIAVVGYLLQLAPLQILGGAHYLSVPTPEQLQALALVLRFRAPASNMVIVFFGFHFILIGYLIFRSTFLPRILGVLVAFAGLCGLLFLAPALAGRILPYFVGVGLVSEVSLALWLVVMGVNASKWRERAGVQVER